MPKLALIDPREDVIKEFATAEFEVAPPLVWERVPDAAQEDWVRNQGGQWQPPPPVPTPDERRQNPRTVLQAIQKDPALMALVAYLAAKDGKTITQTFQDIMTAYMVSYNELKDME